MIKSGFEDRTVEKNNIYLDVVLEDGEDVLTCIEEAFKENEINRAILVSASGSLKDIKLSVTRSGTLKQVDYSQPCIIRSVSGEFYRSVDEYFGDVHISLSKDPIHQLTGVLISGVAHGEIIIKFKIIKNINQKIYKPDKPVTMLKQKILEENKPKEKKPFIEC